ncbi:MAG: hypothetical protein Ct9H300mP16_11960 [Pseudomonadota bacterium]|nr:MAG: hypothetical protein Ct9H300mP16_11960 [Pseudomonadota bacterium]
MDLLSNWTAGEDGPATRVFSGVPFTWNRSRVTNPDFVVVGAGILGLRLPGNCSTDTREAGSGCGKREPARLSPDRPQQWCDPCWCVLHAGSLKAQFCFEGNSAIKAFCREHNIPFEQCGKLLVATSAVELERMQALIERSRQNGLEIQFLDEAQLGEAEPNVTGVGAIRVPSTGIVSYTAICRQLAELIEADGG